MAREQLSTRPPGVWKYRELLPLEDHLPILSLGEGGTMLLPVHRLGAEHHLPRLYVKNETTNPTGSFIDRGMTVVTTALVAEGAEAACCASTGNFGASLAAYTARAGLGCHVVTPSRIDLGKLYQIIAYGAEIHMARNFQEAQDHLQQLPGTAVTPEDALFLDGEKTTGFEIVEQLSWGGPDAIIIPMGNGGHIAMIWHALAQLKELGWWSNGNPRLFGVQLSSAAPIVALYRHDKVPESAGISLTADLEIARPLLAQPAVEAIRQSGGEAISVTEREVLDATTLLARKEGIFAEPAAAATIAAVRKLATQRVVDPSDSIVCIITGTGLKDPATAHRITAKRDRGLRLPTPVEWTARVGPTKQQLLTLLAERPAYGYELWQKLHQRFARRMKIPSVYQHLAELEQWGLITRSGTQKPRGRPERQLYTATERGRNVLRVLRPQI